jgi:RHS repeat-associated protein
MPRISIVRVAFLPSAILLSVFAAAPARAQCTPPWEGQQTGNGCEVPPAVSIAPASMVVSQPSFPFTVTAQDYDNGMVDSTFAVWLDEVRVPGGFRIEAFTLPNTNGWINRRFVKDGIVRVGPSGTATLSAQVCDVHHPQFVPCGTGSATYRLAVPGVRVLPDGESAVVAAATTASASFTVTNTGAENATFALAAECRDEGGNRVSGCGASPSTVWVQAGQSASATVGYPADQAGRVLSVRLVARQSNAASVEDTGWRDVTVQAAAGATRAPPVIQPVPMTAGTAVDRSSCVTVALALRTAYECGDLRVAHALPAHHTRGRAWAPTLVYNSQHAHPRPIVYVDVTIPAGYEVPVWVDVNVRMADGTLHSARFLGSEFVPGVPRRLAVQWDAANTGTGVYRYELQVTNQYPGAPLGTAIHPGEIAVVNRSDSPYGAGWWVAGWESGSCIDCATGGARLLWVMGDGSTRVYEPIVPWQTWEWRGPDGPPDTLRLTPQGYERRLRGGGTVYLDGNGHHFKTVNRLGQETLFNTPSGWALASITPPNTGSGVAPAWSFTYAGGRLQRVSATVQGGPTRDVWLTVSSGRVTAIRDPDGDSVSFVYGNAASPYRIQGHRDRRGTYTAYTYDAFGRLSQSRTWMGAAPVDSVDVIRRFAAAESRGVAAAAPVGNSGAPSVPTSQVFTLIDGPRTDVGDTVRIWLNPNGTVRRVRDPLGAESYAEYGDARFPALATASIAPNGLRGSVVYDARGRVSSSTVHDPLGDGVNRTTTYTWDDRWDQPRTITAPLAGVMRMEYDSVTGNPLWRQQGDDAARRMTFGYYPAGHPHAGQLARTVSPADAQGQTAVDSVYYDARGNLLMTRSALGFRALYRRDALGRDSIVYSPVAAATAGDTAQIKVGGARQEVRYDAMGRAWRTESVGPAIAHAASPDGAFQPAATGVEQLAVETTFDDEGAPLSVTRTIDPNPGELAPQTTTYQYDAAGRRTVETHAGVHSTVTRYDPAGNVVRVTSPRGHAVTTVYDAAGRPLLRRVPEVTYGGSTCGALGNCRRFPFYPNDGTGLTIPGEYTLFRYDAAGNLVYAENRDAVVARTYYPGGALKEDSLRLRDVEGMAITHEYGVGYRYDLAGRLVNVIHPFGGSANLDQYAYHPVTGALASMLDRNGNAFTFQYDNLGRPTSVRMPGGVVDTMAYDRDGRRTWRRETSAAVGATPLQHETMVFDARGKLLQVNALATVDRGASTFTQWYSGMGNLVATDWDNLQDLQWAREQFVVDPLGNRVRKRTLLPGGESPGQDVPDYLYRLNPVFGRVSEVDKVEITTSPAPQDETTFFHDVSGNQERSTQQVQRASGASLDLARDSESRSYYGADEKLRAFQEYSVAYSGSTSTSTGVWEEYRYDPLGRRVMVITRRPSELCDAPGTACLSSVTRFVWSGDQLLWEQKTIDGAWTTASDEAGGTVSYSHAGGIDRPLAIWKEGVGTIVTHQNWRGQFARGTFGVGPRAGQRSDCPSYPPSNGCVPIPWPGWSTTAWHEGVGTPPSTGYEHYWFGSLANEMRDASGQMYMRNRYYDPQSGQFTQMDPIGLAGGLNVYGFAAGDPVTYSDPYGLMACDPPRDFADCKYPLAYGQGRDVIIVYSGGNSEHRSGGTRSWRNNNPGNIRYGPFAQQNGAIGEAGGFAVFPDANSGDAAQVTRLSTGQWPDMSLNEMIATWAPPSENNTAKYQNYVQTATGIGGDTRMGDLSRDQLSSIAGAMKRHEGWRAGTVKTYGTGCPRDQTCPGN